MSDAAFWALVYQCFADALDVPADGRAAFLDTRLEGRAEVRLEVLALLDAHDSADTFLQVPAAPPAQPATEGALEGDGPLTPGTMAGPWRLLDLVGEGGMGRVFRAERADGAYTQQVAVKLTRWSMLDREAARRFRAERAILAGLNHPHIVRLLDGGTLPSGQAWLAMELVDGQPITRAAADGAWSLTARLRLFRQACAAVHYAHQRGVVHRDLKPQNVLVSDEGVAKVVDFGVAKLLDRRTVDVDASATGLTPAPLTPNYASPEQLRGLPVTTASDVYALGVLLYELLAGAKPYETTGQPLDEVLAIVLEREPVRPSAVMTSSGVRAGRAWPRRGDLDAVVLKAMAKAPERRYASAAELEADVGRYLEARPVHAQEPSLAYVASRLARRHVVAFGAAGVALLAVLASLGVSIWQTRVAERERARAETRLADVRRLANTLVFKVHDAVEPLAGSTPVRQVIVQEALGYLERLSQEPGDDPTVRIELTEAYTRIGRVQGDPQQPNLGDREGAIASFVRASDLVEPLMTHADVPVRASALGAAAAARGALSSVYGSLGRKDDAAREARRSVTLVESLAAALPGNADVRRRLGSAYFSLALSMQGTPQAIEQWQKAGAVFEALLDERREDPNRLRNVALVAKYLAAEYDTLERPGEAAAHMARALALDQRRLALAPTDHLVQFDVSNDLVASAAHHTRGGRTTEAAALLERALTMRQQMAEADPKDVLAPGKVGSVEWRLAENALRASDARSARTWAARAVRTMTGMKARSQDLVTLRDHAAAFTVLALSRPESGQASARCEAARQAEATVKEIRARQAEPIWQLLGTDLPRLLAACAAR